MPAAGCNDIRTFYMGVAIGVSGSLSGAASAVTEEIHMHKTGLMLSLLVTSLSLQAAEVSPPNWWANMAEPTVELMVHEPGIANASVTLSHPDAQILKTQRLDSENYLFITLDLSNVKPGRLSFDVVADNGDRNAFQFDVKSRREDSALRKGFGPEDAIYLVTPDRFVNGDPENDNVEGFSDTLARNDKGARHGGDIKGMIDSLPYLHEMGFTQVWTMPLLENAMDSYSYHGYSTTDYYQIDPRFGTNSLYQKFSAEAKEQGIGIIMDMILNHIGSEHIWMDDAPSADWIHHGRKFVQTTHYREALHDPHGTEDDTAAFTDGWFVPTMPDLNQTNPNLATYLIQNAIWWVEYADLSGIRVDTYSYSDKAFLSAWTTRLMQEYPNLNIVGEEWSVNPLITSYWQAGSRRHDDYVSALPCVMDFPLQAALTQALKDEESWSGGLRRLYEILASDFVYGDPYNLVVFADNHDMDRVFTQLNEQPALWDMAMTYLLTTRGIPQIFYGTEILMSHSGTSDHGVIRGDFPGGWQGDEVNAFIGKGLSDDQKWAQQRIKTLLHLRQMQPEWFSGKLTHYTPQNGVYVYFRHNAEAPESKLMVVLNKNKQSASLDLTRFSAMLESHSDITRLSGDTQAMPETLEVPAYAPSVWIID